MINQRGVEKKVMYGYEKKHTERIKSMLEEQKVEIRSKYAQLEKQYQDNYPSIP